MDGLGCTQGNARTLHLNKAPNWRNGDETEPVLWLPPSAQWLDPRPARHHHQPPLRQGTASVRVSFCPAPFRQVLLTVSFERHSRRSTTTMIWFIPTGTTSNRTWTTLTWTSLSRRTRGKVSQNEAHTKDNVSEGESKPASLSSAAGTWKSRGRFLEAMSEPWSESWHTSPAFWIPSIKYNPLTYTLTPCPGVLVCWWLETTLLLWTLWWVHVLTEYLFFPLWGH